MARVSYAMRLKLARLRDFIFRRQTAYRKTFKDNQYGTMVLEDLAHFCRAAETTWHDNERVSALLEGRREVFLRIQQHLKLSPDELFELATGQQRDVIQNSEVDANAPD